MSELYNVLARLCEERGISGYRMCKDVGIQPSVMTDLKMGRRASLKAETARRIANYFGVTLDYLLTGEHKEKAPTSEGERPERKLRSIARLEDPRITPELDERISGFIEGLLAGVYDDELDKHK